VRESGFKVVLTGEGADEVFGGYNIFREAMVRRFWARQPDSALRPRLLARLYPYLSRELATGGGGFMRRFFEIGLEDVDDPFYSHRPRWRTSARNLRFLGPEVREAAAAQDEAAGGVEARLSRALPGGFDAFGPLGKAQALEIGTFLHGYLLHSQGDRMLMANSVEGRFPFLDPDVAAFAARLPERLRLQDLREKHVLRKAVAPLLPDDVGKRPKRPYRAPILRAFVGEDAPAYVAEMLDPDRLEAGGVIDGPAVARLVRKCERYLDAGLGEADEMGLVGVLSTALLQDATVTRPQLAPGAVPTREVVGGEVRIGRGMRPTHTRPLEGMASR